MRLGTVTYNLAKDWDLDTLLAKCADIGLEGVELRTEHAHKVELDLSKAQRAEVKKKFADSPVTLVGLGSTFEYHAVDPAELKRNIDGTKAYTILAEDVGAEGVKVRPNALPDGVSKEKTIEQIGKSLREVGAFAADHGIKIRLEVHGKATNHPPYVKQMLDIADHPNVYACWNSNPSDVDESGSIDRHFAMLSDKIGMVHINRLYSDYPWQRLLTLLKQSGFDGFCLAEHPPSADPETVYRYYRALFNALLEKA
ncbi:MAG: sugar phosphate isomerase/epimerase [Kiritimatiellae bacterium]|nr:sugar phosphate isomerase/epimerase [Kiritimatiellia bacterium]